MAPIMVCRDRLALAFVMALLGGNTSAAFHHRPPKDPPAMAPSSTSTSQVSVYEYSPENCSSMIEFGLVSHTSLVSEEMLPPSPAPSQAPSCEFATSNARGRYTSELNPCTFRFHAVDEAMEEMDFIEYHTSDLCTDENTIGHRSSSSPSTGSTRGAATSNSMSVKEYVKDFPDECVGDFTRCYSLEHHTKIVWEFLCDKEWKLPQGTTHISVDCTADKKLALESAIRERQEATQQRRQSLRTVYQLKFTNFAIVVVSCLFGILVVAHLIIKPMSQMMASSLTLNGPNHHHHGGFDGDGSTLATGDCDCVEVQHQCPCLTSRTSSVSVDETSSRLTSAMGNSFYLMPESDDQSGYLSRMHRNHHQRNQVHASGDHHYSPGAVSHPNLEQQHEPLDGRDDRAQEESKMENEPEAVQVQEGEHGSLHVSSDALRCQMAQPVLEQGDFEFPRQVPADLDAIPFVPALPIDDDHCINSDQNHPPPLRAQNVEACPEGL